MSENAPLAVVGATAFAGPGLAPLPDSVVVADGHSIAAVGRRDDVPIPDDARVLDATGMALLPGFIDSHVHIGLAEASAVLRGGVTTVRDLGWPLSEIVPAARRSLEWDHDGPLIVAAGPMLTVENGYPITAAWAPEGTGVAISSETHARQVVAELGALGVAVVKVALNPPAGDVLSQEMLEAIVAAAHGIGAKVTGHIYGLEQLEKALDAGVDELAHALMSPERIPEHVISRMVKRGVALVPTLSIFPEDEAAIAIQNVADLVAAGGVVVYGTDLGNEGPGPGIDELEVTRMEAAGMDVWAIVRSATVDAARWLELDNKGAIEVGRDADLICLASPPAAAADLTAVRHVIRAGRLIS
jgi:imidazolonepropionase-like amidohydrolase